MTELGIARSVRPIQLSIYSKKIKVLDILDLAFLQSLAKVETMFNFCLTRQFVLPGKKVLNPNKQYFVMNINTQIKIQCGISS